MSMLTVEITHGNEIQILLFDDESLAAKPFTLLSHNLKNSLFPDLKYADVTAVSFTEKADKFMDIIDNETFLEAVATMKFVDASGRLVLNVFIRINNSSLGNITLSADDPAFSPQREPQLSIENPKHFLGLAGYGMIGPETNQENFESTMSSPYFNLPVEPSLPLNNTFPQANIIEQNGLQSAHYGVEPPQPLGPMNPPQMPPKPQAHHAHPHASLKVEYISPAQRAHIANMQAYQQQLELYQHHQQAQEAMGGGGGFYPPMPLPQPPVTYSGGAYFDLMSLAPTYGRFHQYTGGLNRPRRLKRNPQVNDLPCAQLLQNGPLFQNKPPPPPFPKPRRLGPDGNPIEVHNMHYRPPKLAAIAALAATTTTGATAEGNSNNSGDEATSQAAPSQSATETMGQLN